MLNKYLDRLDRLIASYSAQELKQFRALMGEPARWDDPIWFHICPNTGFETRFLAGTHGVHGRGRSGCQPEFRLRQPYDGLIKVWIIEVTNAAISTSERQARVTTARNLLTHMTGDLYRQTAEGVTSLIGNGRSLDRLRPFLAFSAQNGLMPSIDVKSHDDRDRTGHAAFDTRKDKLPDLDAVLLLGSLHKEIFQPVSQRGLVASGQKVPMMDAVATTFGLLGLASPNRLAAEVPVLAKQRLQKYSENGGKPVHYLDWAGSKGFRDNRNHILAVLADEVERSVNFFFNECEPARMLCRFYENPKQRLGDLLGDFEISKDRVRHLRLDEPPPNLFVLGYALGFYREDAQVLVVLPGVEVPDDLAHNQKQYRERFTKKPIHLLRDSDRLACSLNLAVAVSSIPYLLGYQQLGGSSAEALELDKQPLITVADLQERWIDYFTTKLIPTFPYSHSTGEGKIRLADALFCIHGPLMYQRSSAIGSGGKTLAKALYSVAPLEAVGIKAAQLLSGSSGAQKSLFIKRGYRDTRVMPHSLRHLGNTLAELSEIPREITTAWSGRCDPEQTDTYLHDRHEEQSRRVREVMNPSEHDRREIRVVGQDAIARTTNLPASIMSTGVCTQELHLDPCDYLNDFVSQCFMCPSACHIAGDAKAIDLFEKDHQVQVARLAQVKNDSRLPISLAMKKWFVIHSRNTHVLACLVDFMKTLASGVVVRYSPKTSEFHITDAGSSETQRLPCLIPDFESELAGLLAPQTAEAQSDVNPALRSLLSTFGLSDEAA